MLKRELKINFKSLIIWSSIMIGMFVLVFAIYPSIASSSEDLNKLINTMPKELLAAFNMDLVGFSTAFSWFQTEGNVFLILLGSLYAAILGGTILVKEESNKTIEYLYSKPINRNKIITSKILCAKINLFIFTLIVAITNMIGLILSKDISYGKFFLLSLSPLIVFISVFYITLFISTFFRKTSKSMGIAIGFVLISYFLQIIGNMSTSVKYIKYFSVFELAPARYIILNNHLNYLCLFIAIIISCLSIYLTYYRYNRKELV